MNQYQDTLNQLQQNLNLLREREAKYGGNAPLELLNQIIDHQEAIVLTEQTITGELTEAQWREAMRPLIVAINTRDGEANVNSVTFGNIHGSIIASEIAGRDISIGQKIVNIFTGGPDSQRELRNRQIMLQQVYDFWVKGVLENSLHNEVLIQLGMEEHKEAVDYPWNIVIQRRNQPNRQLPPDTRITDIFDESNGSLLILGEPGSGKTTMLLELTRQLIYRARVDPNQPIPVVFNLSSWAEKHLPLSKWLVEELNIKYQIPRKIAQSWVENDELLLLLDGLDEVAHQYRLACVEALNNFHRNSLMSLVVCSRIGEYETLSSKLNFQQAILLQPLGQGQIETYLTRIGQELTTLQVALQQDNNLHQLARTPLMLSIIILTYKNKSSIPVLKEINTVSARQKYLLETYVEEMFKRRGYDARYSPKQTICWLVYLAKRLIQNTETVFLLERMQPDWMQGQGQRKLYELIFRVFFGLIFGLILGVSTGILFDLRIGLVIGLYSFLFLWLLDEITDQLFGKEFKSEPVTFSLVYAVRITVGVIFSIPLVLFLNIDTDLVTRLTFSLCSGFIGILVGGINPGQMHIYTFEKMTWSRETALFWFNQRVIGAFLIGSVFLLLTGITIGLVRGLIYSLIVGLVFSILIGLSVAVYGGLSELNIEAKIVSNQEIWQSVRNANTIGLLFGINLTLITGIVLGLLFEPTIAITIGVSLGLLSGLRTGMRRGGLAFLQHFALRYVLYLKSHIPWNYIRFLDYCAERIFLRKVGGGYIFIHRYLMEYFASLTPEDIERLSTELEPKKAQPA